MFAAELPAVLPNVENLVLQSPTWTMLDQRRICGIRHARFVLAAGPLGERLAANDLPSIIDNRGRPACIADRRRLWHHHQM